MDPDQNRNRNSGALIGMIISGLVLIISIALLIWVFYDQNPPGAPCTSTSQCLANQNCNDGFCVNTTCTLNSDCGPSQECVNGICTLFTCVSNTDCGKDTVCQNGTCTPIGATCTTSNDCNGGTLICNTGGICVQCQTSEDCSEGVCGSDGRCYPNCSGITGACPGQSCIHDFCCEGTRSDYPGFCSPSSPCPSEQFCVNGACTCAPGPDGASCNTGADCQSTNCIGGICVVSGGNCFANHNPKFNGVTGYCPAGSPYCASGTCSQQSEGSPCSCSVFTNSGNTTCTIYNSCNIQATGFVNPNTTTTYCVNSVCDTSPGWLGAVCTSDFDCAPISGSPNCTNGTSMSGKICI